VIKAQVKVEIIKVKSQKSVFATISKRETNKGARVIITISLEVFNASCLESFPDNQIFGFIAHFEGSTLQSFPKKLLILFLLFFSIY